MRPDGNLRRKALQKLGIEIKRLFEAGKIVFSNGTIEYMRLHPDLMREFLSRHLTGDWGDLCEEDKQYNNNAVRTGERIMSEYHLPDGTRIWIATEWDRSATTFLLPDEY